MKKIALSFSLVALTLLGINASTEAQATRYNPTTLAATNGEVVNIVLHDGNLSYTVPVGKILVIEHLFWSLESGSTHQTVNIEPGGGSAAPGDYLLKFGATAPDIWTPERPLKIVGDGQAGVSILLNSQVDWRDVAILGVLRDV